MIKQILQIFNLLERKQQKKIIYLQILILLTACMEVVSLFAVAPFISILSNFDLVYKDGYISYIYIFFWIIFFIYFVNFKYNSYVHYMESFYK